MKKTVLYTYLGTNGTITSPIHLEDTYYVRSYLLSPDPGYKLTKDGTNLVSSAVATDDNINEWMEVEDPGQD